MGDAADDAAFWADCAEEWWNSQDCWEPPLHFTCRYCGQEGLVWCPGELVYGEFRRWVQVGPDNKVHNCFAQVLKAPSPETLSALLEQTI